MEILYEICTQLQQGRAKNVRNLVQEALSQGIQPKEILEEGLLKGMDIIGGKFKRNEVFVPEVLVAARAMNMGVAELKPYMSDSEGQVHGKVVIGTVAGDLHDIGKNLVKLMIESKGLEVIDLGTDVSPDTFVQAVQEHHCNIVACSALLTTTMGGMSEVVKALEMAGLRDKVTIMIGGAPVTEAFCKQIGADIYTDDAASAADAAVEAMKKMERR